MVTFRYESAAFSEEVFAAGGKFVAVVLGYNQRSLVGRAVRSALAQDYPCYEVVALDDASTDGSAGEMTEAVLNFVAAHPERPVRITVAVNDGNRSVLGQWRQAVELSGGDWFGMFCGDDEALPERISTVAALVREHPGATGVCTNFLDGETGRPGLKGGLFVRRREDVLWTHPKTAFGCTAFWHRRILTLDLPRGNMDDFILYWLGVSAETGDFVWALDCVTVKYSVGAGLTTEGRRKIDACRWRAVKLWKTYGALVRRGRRFGRSVWEAIAAFDARYGKRPQISRQIHGLRVLSATEGGGWWTRLRVVWSVTVTDRGNDYGGLRRHIARAAWGRFLTRLFGPVSFVAAHLLFDRREEDAA